MNSQMQSSLINLESDRNNYDFKYSIENLTGEEILVATHETDEFISVYANQVMMLDFSHKYEDLNMNKSPPSSKKSRNTQNVRSPYRKENFRIQSSLEGRMKKVYLFIPNLTSDGSAFYEENEHSEKLVIDVHELQQQKCIKLFVGEEKKYYFLCHEQKSSNDQRKLVLRSPIQVRNTLKVPVEIKFDTSHIKGYSDQQNLQKSESGEYQESHNFKLYLNPDSTSIVPIKMIDSEKLKNNNFMFQLRPITLESNFEREGGDHSDYDISPSFVWSNEATFGIQTQTEKQLFETKPVTLKCKIFDAAEDEYIYISTSLTTKSLSEKNVVRFISINAPYTILNSLPFDMRLFLNAEDQLGDDIVLQNPHITDLLLKEKKEKNILKFEENKEDIKVQEKFQKLDIRKLGKSKLIGSKYKKSQNFLEMNPIEENQEEDSNSEEEINFKKISNYPPSLHFPYIDIKSSEELGLLDTDPDAELSISIQPFLYRASNFLNITKELEEIEDSKEQNLKIPKEMEKTLIQKFKQRCRFRFLRKNTFIFQVTKSNIKGNMNSQINICCDVTSIQGFYKLHFYTKYWFVNSSELPLSLKFSEREYEYPEISLPYSSKNFEQEKKSEEVQDPISDILQ